MGLLDGIKGFWMGSRQFFMSWSSFSKLLPSSSYEDADEWKVIIDKKARDFAMGKLIAVDNDGNELKNHKESKEIINFLLTGNKLQGWADTLENFKRNQHLTGVGRWYFRGLSLGTPQNYVILEEEALNITYNNQNPIQISSHSDIIDDITYNINSNITLDKESLLSVFDVSFDYITKGPIKRSASIKKKLELLANTNDSITGAMKRTKLAYLVPDNGNNPLADVARVSASPSTDTQVKTQDKKFQEDHSIKEGAITYLNKPMKLITANPDNGKLKAFEAFKHGMGLVSLELGMNPKILQDETKFDDMEMAGAQYIAVMKVEGSELGQSLTKILVPDAKNWHLDLDFSELRKLYLKEDDNGDAQIRS